MEKIRSQESGVRSRKKRFYLSIINCQLSILLLRPRRHLLSAACCKLKAVFTNFSILNSQFSILLLALLFLASCHKPAATTQKPIPNFPPQMVGTWDCQYGPLGNQRWQLTFEKDGTISKLYHYVFGVITVSDGGAFTEGPDPNTYMTYALGPVEAEYDPASKTIKAKVVIDDYEMKLPTGSLQGRIIDKLDGRASQDGKTWNVEWRSYSWLKGAAEPNMAWIDANPEQLVFQKVNLSDPNTKGQ